MSVGLPRQGERPEAAAASAAPEPFDHNSLQRHGNAASSSADGRAREAIRSADRSLGLRRSPESLPVQPEETSTWSPRPLTVDELRARFRESAGVPPRAMPGTPVDRLGRRLTDFDLDEQEERQRMPEPIPTSWQSPVMPEPPSAVMRHMGSGLLGLTVGLAIAVPGVLWHKGRIDPQTFIEVTMADLGRAFASTSGAGAINGRRAEADAPRAAIVRVEEIRPSAATEGSIQTVATVASALPVPRAESVARAETAPVQPPLAVPRYQPSPPQVAIVKPTPVEVVTTTPAPPPVKPEVAILDDARRLIGEGDFPAARKVLENDAVVETPMARFLLAETFDPNFLAARGIRSVRAEVPRAIELYKEALDGGVDAARQRLNALRP